LRLRQKLAQIKNQLTGYSEQLLNGLHQTILHRGMFASELYILISNGNHSAAAIHEHMTFRPHLSLDTDLSTVHGMIRGLHQYPQLPQTENYAEAPADVQAQVIALLKVAEALEVSYVLDTSCNNLIELVLNRPSQADRIVDIIRDRETMDAKFITSILDSPAPSLSNGIL
jgi:hypothetical protein